MSRRKFERAKRASIRKWGQVTNTDRECGFCLEYDSCDECPIFKIENSCDGHHCESILQKVEREWDSDNWDYIYSDLARIAILLYLHSLEYEEGFAI